MQQPGGLLSLAEDVVSQCWRCRSARSGLKILLPCSARRVLVVQRRKSLGSCIEAQGAQGLLGCSAVRRRKASALHLHNTPTNCLLAIAHHKAFTKPNSTTPIALSWLQLRHCKGARRTPGVRVCWCSLAWRCGCVCVCLCI